MSICVCALSIYTLVDMYVNNMYTNVRFLFLFPSLSLNLTFAILLSFYLTLSLFLSFYLTHSLSLSRSLSLSLSPSLSLSLSLSTARLYGVFQTFSDNIHWSVCLCITETAQTH